MDFLYNTPPVVLVLLGAFAIGAIFGLVGVAYKIVNYLRAFASEKDDSAEEKFFATALEISNYSDEDYHAVALRRNVWVFGLLVVGFLGIIAAYILFSALGIDTESDIAHMVSLPFVLAIFASPLVSIFIFIKNGGHKIISFVKRHRTEYLAHDYETTVEYEKYDDEPDSAWRERSRTTVDKNAFNNFIIFIVNAIKFIIGAVFFAGGAAVHYIAQMLVAIYLLFIRKPFLRMKAKKQYKEYLLSSTSEGSFCFDIQGFEKEEPQTAKLIISLHKKWVKKTQHLLFEDSDEVGLFAFQDNVDLMAIQVLRRIGSHYGDDSQDAVFFDTREGRVCFLVTRKTKMINTFVMYSYIPSAELFEGMDLEGFHGMMATEWGYLRLATGAWEPDTEVRYLAFDRDNGLVRSMCAKIGDIVVQENGVYRADPATEVAAISIEFPPEVEEASTGITSAQAKVVTPEEEATEEPDNEAEVAEVASAREDSVTEDTSEEMEKSTQSF